jgi:hypothetical protein
MQITKLTKFREYDLADSFLTSFFLGLGLGKSFRKYFSVKHSKKHRTNFKMQLKNIFEKIKTNLSVKKNSERFKKIYQNVKEMLIKKYQQLQRIEGFLKELNELLVKEFKESKTFLDFCKSCISKIKREFINYKSQLIVVIKNFLIIILEKIIIENQFHQNQLPLLVLIISSCLGGTLGFILGWFGVKTQFISIATGSFVVKLIIENHVYYSRYLNSVYQYCKEFYKHCKLIYRDYLEYLEHLRKLSEAQKKWARLIKELIKLMEKYFKKLIVQIKDFDKGLAVPEIYEESKRPWFRKIVISIEIQTTIFNNQPRLTDTGVQTTIFTYQPRVKRVKRIIRKILSKS